MVLAVGLLVVPGKAVAKEVDVYFGSGNFYRLQHEFVLKEALALDRRAGDITSVAGYAGGTRVGELDRICFSSFGGSPDYKQLGQAQVVRVTLPDDAIPDFARIYFDELPNRKSFEQGGHYRAAIGLRGGVKSPVFPLIERANNGRLKLVAGEGDEPDTYGGDTVYVYDSKKFPFRPAEVVNQFENDPPDVYTSDYRGLRDVLKGIGYIFTTGCPEMRI